MTTKDKTGDQLMASIRKTKTEGATPDSEPAAGTAEGGDPQSGDSQGETGSCQAAPQHRQEEGWREAQDHEGRAGRERFCLSILRESLAGLSFFGQNGKFGSTAPAAVCPNTPEILIFHACPTSNVCRAGIEQN